MQTPSKNQATSRFNLRKLLPGNNFRAHSPSLIWFMFWFILFAIITYLDWTTVLISRAEYAKCLDLDYREAQLHKQVAWQQEQMALVQEQRMEIQAAIKLLQEQKTFNDAAKMENEKQQALNLDNAKKLELEWEAVNKQKQGSETLKASNEAETERLDKWQKEIDEREERVNMAEKQKLETVESPLPMDLGSPEEPANAPDFLSYIDGLSWNFLIVLFKGSFLLTLVLIAGICLWCGVWRLLSFLRNSYVEWQHTREAQHQAERRRQLDIERRTDDNGVVWDEVWGTRMVYSPSASEIESSGSEHAGEEMPNRSVLHTPRQRRYTPSRFEEAIESGIYGRRSTISPSGINILRSTRTPIKPVRLQF